MDRIKLPLHRVRIERDRSTVYVKDVPEHEIEVLKRVHTTGGQDNVHLVQENVGEIEFDNDPAAELDRLSRCYVRTGAADPVKLVFPHGARSLVDFGFGPKEKGKAKA